MRIYVQIFEQPDRTQNTASFLPPYIARTRVVSSQPRPKPGPHVHHTSSHGPNYLDHSQLEGRCTSTHHHRSHRPPAWIIGHFPLSSCVHGSGRVESGRIRSGRLALGSARPILVARLGTVGASDPIRPDPLGLNCTVTAKQPHATTVTVLYSQPGPPVIAEQPQLATRPGNCG